jgi:hypothetical protein
MKYILAPNYIDISDTSNPGLPDPKILWGREPRQWSWPVRPSGQNRRGVVRAKWYGFSRRGYQMSQISYRMTVVAPNLSTVV